MHSLQMHELELLIIHIATVATVAEMPVPANSVAMCDKTLCRCV